MDNPMSLEQAVETGAKRFYCATFGGVWEEHQVATISELKDPFTGQEFNQCVFMPIPSPIQILDAKEHLRKLARESADLLAQVAELQAAQTPIK